MKNLFDILVVLFLICLSLGLVDPTAEAKVDQHTIAVWLFEEESGDRLVGLADAGDGHVGASKERGELVEILLLPIVAKMVIVTLDAVDAHAKERPCYSRGQLHLIGIILFLVLIDRHGDKVDLRVVGPKPLGGDQ